MTEQADKPTEAPAKKIYPENASYLIWSNEHGRWWGPAQRGYVRGLNSAGRYSREGAISICRNALGTSMAMGMFAELPVRLEDIDDIIAGQMLPGTMVRG